MGMVFAMFAIFLAAGALGGRLDRWTLAAMLLGIGAVLVATRLTF